MSGTLSDGKGARAEPVDQRDVKMKRKRGRDRETDRLSPVKSKLLHHSTDAQRTGSSPVTGKWMALPSNGERLTVNMVSKDNIWNSDITRSYSDSDAVVTDRLLRTEAIRPFSLADQVDGKEEAPDDSAVDLSEVGSKAEKDRLAEGEDSAPRLHAAAISVEKLGEQVANFTPVRILKSGGSMSGRKEEESPLPFCNGECEPSASREAAGNQCRSHLCLVKELISLRKDLASQMNLIDKLTAEMTSMGTYLGKMIQVQEQVTQDVVDIKSQLSVQDQSIQTKMAHFKALLSCYNTIWNSKREAITDKVPVQETTSAKTDVCTSFWKCLSGFLLALLIVAVAALFLLTVNPYARQCRIGAFDSEFKLLTW